MGLCKIRKKVMLPFVILLLLFAAFPAWAIAAIPSPSHETAQKEPINIRFEKGLFSINSEGATLGEVVGEIEKYSGFTISIDEDLKTKPVSINSSGLEITKTLRVITTAAGLGGYGITYKSPINHIDSPGKMGQWVVDKITMVSLGDDPEISGKVHPAEKKSENRTDEVTKKFKVFDKEPFFDKRLNRYVEVVKGEVLVRFSKEITPKEIEKFHKENGTRAIKGYEKIGAHLIKIPATETVQEFIEKHSVDGKQAYVEPVFLTMQQAVIVNDPSFKDQWSIPQIKADKAWELNNGGIDITVAIIDTGIDIAHPDLKNKVVQGFNIVDGNSTVMDDNGHGTYLAGIIAAEANNSVGIAGISWQSRLMPVKVLNAAGEGKYSDLIEGIIYAVDHGARILNLSLGGYSYSQFLEDAIQYAHSNWAVIVAAGGNENTNELIYPASYSNVIGVSATDPSDQRWFSSNYGNYIKLSAPGVSVLSTQRDNGYGDATGTSVSTAHVSGVAALILSKNPDLSSTQVENILYQTADDLGDKGWDSYYGFGRVNALKAIEKAGIEIHDVAITGIRIEPETFKVGEATKIIVTVENQGTFVERNLSVNAFVNNEVVDKEQIVLEIIPGEKKYVSFNWSPLIDGKEFTVQAEVKVVEGETETNDNKYVRAFIGAEKDGLVKIKHKSEPDMQTHQFMAGEAAKIWPGGYVTDPSHNEIWDYIGGRVEYYLNDGILWDTKVTTYGGRYNGQPVTYFDPWTLQSPDPRRIAVNDYALPYSEFNSDKFANGCPIYLDLIKDSQCGADNLSAGPVSNGGDDIIEGTHEEDIFDAINYHKHDDIFYNGTDPDGAYMFAEHLWRPDSYDVNSETGDGVSDAGLFDDGLKGFTEMPGVDWEHRFQNHRSAYSKAQDYWDHYVIPNYNKGNKDLAYYYLGRVVHLLEDMSSTPHVHNEYHGPGQRESYEEYNGVVHEDVNNNGVIDIQEDRGYVVWSSYEWAMGKPYKENNYDKSIDYNNISEKILDEWYSHSGDFNKRWLWWVNKGKAKEAFYKMPPLFRIFYSMAETTDDFPSDTGSGDIIYDPQGFGCFGYNDIPKHIDDNPPSFSNCRRGDDPAEKYYINLNKPLKDLDGNIITGIHYNVDEFSRYIQPIALRHIAGLYKLFWDTVQPPTVNTFHVNPIFSKLGDTVNISYDVSDMGGLKQVELWRTNDVNDAPDPNWPKPDSTWPRTTSLSGQTSHQGAFSDTPTAIGTYWYGIHVVDNENNWNDQRNSKTGGWPRVFEPVKVTVTASSDITPPTVSITAPSNGSTVNGNVTVTTSTYDNIGVSRVEFYKDNSATKAGQDNSTPFSWSWNTTDTANGTHTLYAKAFDAAGNIRTSSPITVNINNTTSSGGNNAPSITTYLTQHKSDGTGMGAGDTTNERTIIMKGGVTDPDGDSVSLDVEVKAVGTNFSNSASLNCTVSSYVSSGSMVAVTCTGLADGQYKWQARAKDNRSPAGYSAWVDAGYSGDVADFIVSAGPAFINYPPTVNVISPHGGETLVAGNSYDIKWDATDSTGIIQHIELYLSTDGGVNWQLMHANEPNDGVYPWTPAITTTQARIRVDAVDSYGEHGRGISNSNFSIIAACTSPSAPLLYDIGTLNENGSYTVSWTNVYGAESYTLQEATNGSFVSPVDYSSLPQPSKSISGKITNTYYYHVKANNSCGSSGWSNVVSIPVVINQPPSVPSNPLPADVASNVSRQPVLSWIASDPEGLVDYAVFLGTNPSDLPAVRGFNSGTTAPSYTVNYDLNPGTTYYWYIKAKDDKGLITPGPVWKFTTGYSYADLVPTNLSITGTVAPNAQVILNLTVKNQGAYTSPGAQVFFYLSSASGGKEQKLQNLGTIIPQLAPGEETTIHQTVTLANLKAGQSYVDAWIDTQGYFVDGNLANNNLSLAVNYQDVTAPVISSLWLVGNGTFRTGHDIPIAWNVIDEMAVTAIDFYYSIDNGTSWNPIASGFVPGSNGYGNSYLWPMPADFPLTNQLVIKMAAWDGSMNSSEVTAGPYTVISGMKPTVTVVSPNGGEEWGLGTTHTIQWNVNAPNGISSMKLSLLWAGHADIIADVTANISGSYQWTIPHSDFYVANDAKIRVWVEDLNLNVSEDTSDASFVIRDASLPPPPPWTTPMPVTTVQPGSQPGKMDIRPAIATDASGNAHLAYLFVADDFLSSPRTITQKVMYKKRIGSVWTTPTVAYSRTQTTDASMNGYHDIQDIRIAVDGNGNPHLVWTDSVSGDITSFNQTEINCISYNGSIWSGPFNVSGTSGMVSVKPEITIDPSSNIHVVWRDGYSYNSNYTLNGTSNVFYRKRDSAGNWSSVSQLTSGGGVSPSVTSDLNGNLHLVYQINNTTNLAYMNWYGSNWSAPVIILSQARNASVSLTSDRHNNLHLIWYNYDYALNSYQILYSTYDGGSWTFPEDVFDHIPGQYPRYPSVVTDSMDRPHVVWEEGGNEYRVSYKVKNVQGWSQATKVSLDSQSPEQFSTTVTISPADHLHVVWASYYNGYTEIFYNHADVSLDTVPPGILLLTPVFGETLSIGNPYTISWTSVDNTGVAGVTLKYTTDGGITLTQIAQGLPGTGTYDWTIPNLISDKVQIFATALDTFGNQATAISGLFSIADKTSPTVSLLSPNGGELFEYDSVHTITWTASDNVTVSAIDLFYSIDGGLSWTPIATGEQNDGSFFWTVPYNLSPDCLIKIVAYDTSGRFTTDVSKGTFMIVSLNNPPLVPNSPTPLDGETYVSLQPILNWSGGDADISDTVTYTVYFGESNNPPVVSVDQSTTDYNPGLLTPLTTYYWMVVASDGKTSTSSPLWSFTTGSETISGPTNLSASAMSPNQINITWTDHAANEIGYEVERKIGVDGTYSEIVILPADTVSYNDFGLNGNTTYVYRVKSFNTATTSQYSNEAMAITGNTAPNTPSLPFPAYAATSQSMNPILQWSGGDPDPLDNITYDVYFGSSSNPPLISSGQTETYFIPGVLEYNSVYYWKVIATDSNGNTTIGPLWYFVTESLPVYSLIVTKSGSGTGMVSSSPAGINCGGDCSESYNNVVGITLTAVPDNGSVFTGWSGDPDCSDGVVTMNAAMNCTATFEQTHPLTVNKTGAGSGTVISTPPGIDCGAYCSTSFINGTVVSLTATPDGNSLFAGWSGDCSGTDLSVSVTMDAGKTCTAKFIVGLIGEYYNNSDMTGLGLVRIDPVINFDWGTGSPDPAPLPVIDADTFAIRWTGKLQVDYNETYTFNAITDDGVRLWIDGHLVLDYWQVGGVSQNNTMNLAAGLHDIKVEFFEDTGAALAQLSWSSPSAPYAIIPNDHLYLPDGAGASPVLEWAGFTGFVADGVEPESGDTTTVFTYLVKYTDADGNPPMNGFPRVHVLKGGVEITGSPYVMSYASGDYAVGAIYHYVPILTAGTDYTYYFDAVDNTGLQSVATPLIPTPTAPVDAPDVAGNILTVTKAGTGSGRLTSSPPGIDCGADCTESYNSGDTITLTAFPDAGSVFAGWGGDLDCIDGVVTMDTNKTCIATFVKTWFEENDPAITYTGTWSNYTCAPCSSGVIKISNKTGAKATFTFNGTGFKWIAAKANQLGKAKVYVDGVYTAITDLFSTTNKIKQIAAQVTGLTPGNHTITIVVSGQKNTSSTGYYIDIDAFEVVP